MHRIIEAGGRCALDELLTRRKCQIIVGLFAVRAPVPLVSASVGVKDDNSAVEVAIGYE